MLLGNQVHLEDDNSDSLVLKVECGESSAILTGDATGLTTQRIINNFHVRPEFLRTNVLLASHHGSSSHECNNAAWVQATWPEVVLISHGLSQGHPTRIAYDIFSASPRLKGVTSQSSLEKKKLKNKHQIFIPNAKAAKEGTLCTTHRAIFSTLMSYHLKAVLRSKSEGIELSTGREGKITLAKLDKETIPLDVQKAVSVEGSDKDVIFRESSSQGKDSESPKTDPKSNPPDPDPKGKGGKPQPKRKGTGEISSSENLLREEQHFKKQKPDPVNVDENKK